MSLSCNRFVSHRFSRSSSRPTPTLAKLPLRQCNIQSGLRFDVASSHPHVVLAKSNSTVLVHPPHNPLVYRHRTTPMLPMGSSFPLRLRLHPRPHALAPSISLPLIPRLPPKHLTPLLPPSRLPPPLLRLRPRVPVLRPHQPALDPETRHIEANHGANVARPEGRLRRGRAGVLRWLPVWTAARGDGR